MRLCFIVGTLGRGGAERQLLYMLRALKKTGIQIRVLSLTAGETYEQDIQDLGIGVECVGGNPSRLARLAAIVTAVRREPADIIQSTHFYTNHYAAVAARFIGATSVGAVRGNLREALRGSRPFGLVGLLMPDYLVVNSRPALQDALKRGRSPERVVLLTNVVDTNRFSPGDQFKSPATDRLRLLFVGRLTGEKRADRFLRLVHGITQVLPGQVVEAKIAGDGPDRPMLEALRSSLQLDPDRVRFIGEAQDTAPLYHWADMLVLTSDHEGTPNVILEAMACRLPVVAAAVGGVPDLLRHGGGLAVRPEDEKAFAEAVLRLHRNRELAESLAVEGSRYVAHNHSLDSLGARLTSIYDTIIGAEGCGRGRRT
jgi:glycosyltransferase involved in cell wall biosynthesis